MFVTRLVALGFARKKRREQELKKKGAQPQQYYRDYQDDLKKKNKGKENLVYNSRPLAALFMGTAMCLTGSILIHVINIHHEELKKATFTSIFTKYLICVAIICVGLMFYWSAETETVEINKMLNFIVKQKVNMCRRRNTEVRDVTNLKEIKIIKRGHESVDTNSIHFLIRFIFQDQPNFEAIEKNSFFAIKKIYVEILTFLNMPINFDQKFDYEDLSTTNKWSFHRKKKNDISQQYQNETQEISTQQSLEPSHTQQDHIQSTPPLQIEYKPNQLQHKKPEPEPEIKKEKRGMFFSYPKQRNYKEFVDELD